MPMSLKEKLKTGGGPSGTRLVIYADTKAGKTTTASQAPSPIFVGTDDGFRRLTVQGLDAPETWPDFLAQIEEVVEEGPEAGFQTLVIDTLNGVADLCAQYICDQHFSGLWADSKKGFLAWGGHQGWTAVSEEMKKIFPLIDKLVDQGWWIVVLCHQKVEKVADPIEGDFDRYGPAVHRAVWARFAAWADAILRISFDAGIDPETGNVICDGTRILKCAATSAEVAGTRAGYELPATMPLSWANIEEKLGGVDVALVEKVRELLGELDTDDLSKAIKYLGSKGVDDLGDCPPHKLKALAGRLQARSSG
jgi:hypothetical protein